MAHFKTTTGAALALIMGATPALANPLYLYSWAGYTAPELIEKFEAETGIEVILDTYDSNEMLLARLQAGATGYDIVVPSQHFVEIMIAEGLLQEIDATGLSNYENIEEQWRNNPWDPEQSYTVPWHHGSASFSYRADLYSGPAESLSEFFAPAPEVSGRLQVLGAPDEVYNMANLYLDLPFCSEDPDHARQVLELFEAQKPDVLLYSSEGMSDRLTRGEVIMAAHWSGYALQGRLNGNENITYAYPREGIVGWFDSLVVPVGAQNVDSALEFMNFMLLPENAAIQSNFTGYANAIEGSEAYFADHLIDAPELSVPEGVEVKFGVACGPEAQALIDRVWTQLLQ